MSKAHAQAVAMLIVVLGSLAAYSFSDFTLSVASIALKKNRIKAFIQPAESESTQLASSSWLKGRVGNKANSIGLPPAGADTAKHRILLFGDSMLEQLMFRMKDYTEANGHAFQPVIWYGSSTKLWGSCDTLAFYIKKFKPDYIICCLGGNELFIRNIVEERTPYVQSILRQIGNIKYFWLGPPNWKKDTGINSLIKSQVLPGCYYPSMNLKLARKHDGAHPTRQASTQWMDCLAVWMRSPNCRFRIKMETPAQKAHATPNAILLKMNL
jgi:hypothetical protein